MVIIEKDIGDGGPIGAFRTGSIVGSSNVQPEEVLGHQCWY